MGIEPDKLYNNMMIHGTNEYYYKAMDREKPYYFQIEAINENGFGKRTEVIKVEWVQSGNLVSLYNSDSA